MNLQGIFEAITPDNIKELPLIQTAMKIFIENLEKNAQVAEDISNIYNSEYLASDIIDIKDVNGNVIDTSSILRDSKVTIRKGLLDVYLNVLYNVLKDAQTNPVIKQRIDEQIAAGAIGDIPLQSAVDEVLNNEYFGTNKPYKERVGTANSVKFAYNLAGYLYDSGGANDMKLDEIKPFHFKTEGTIIRELYEHIVKPLSHPIGFTYNYTQLIKDSFNDLFGIKLLTDFKHLEVRNIDGQFHVFTPDTSDAKVRADFLTRFNPITNTFFTDSTFNQQVTVYTNKVVSDFTDSTDAGRTIKKFWFTDGTYLQQSTNPTTVIYTTYSGISGTAPDLNTTLFDYSGHWSLFLDYSTAFEYTFTDTWSTEVTTDFGVDEIIVTNPSIVLDTFSVFTQSLSGFYLNSTEAGGTNDFYLVSDEGTGIPTDNFYFTVLS